MAKKKRECSPERQAAFDEAMERIKETTGARTQVQLAEVLDVRQSSISDAKRRCSVPPDWLLKLQRITKIHADWYLTGQEPKFLAGTNHDALEELARTVRGLTEEVVGLVNRVEANLEIITMTEAELQRRKGLHTQRLAEDVSLAQGIAGKLKDVSAAVAGLRQ